MTYEEYLRSPEWKAKQEERARIDGYRCVMCNSNGTQINRLECHHLSYRNKYHENPYTDLVTLCRNCHRSVHHLLERVTDENGRRGWLDNPQIPTIHVYDLGGETAIKEGEI